MKRAPSLDSIKVRLRRALPQFLALPGISEQVGAVPLSSVQLERSVKNVLKIGNEWLAAVPSFQDVQHWVEVHWDTERKTRPPAATVSVDDEWVQHGEVQLDDLTATCKLLLTAAGYGAETVARCALQFAAHGMIEVCSFYLMKGMPVLNARLLDDYCTLLPYPEALQKVKAASSEQSLVENLGWPPESADNVCVLEANSFERRGLVAGEFERRESRLLQGGPGTLELILGLVWGTGFRVFGGWNGVAEPVAATLPFFRTTASEGRWSAQALLTLPGFRRSSTKRPLNEAELVELIGKYVSLPKKTKRVLNLALRRLRDSTERVELEDTVIDVCIALEALFMEGEHRDQKTIVSRRGSWYFADSRPEREQTRNLLKEFYDERSAIVHGVNTGNLTPAEEGQRESRLVTLTAHIENVARASLKDMISEGRPQNWEDSKDPGLIRHDPPRAETDIPSVKSDSMSWAMAEQNEIDQALEAVWKPEVDSAPPRPPDAASVVHGGINAKAIEQCRQQGIPYVISFPIRLYMAHPMWPKQEGDAIDERTKYYCERDVERHLRRWQEGAARKRMHRFELPLDVPTMYLPKRFDMWRKFLQLGGLS